MTGRTPTRQIERRRTARLARALVLVTALAAATSYLAGYLFLWSVGEPVRQATPATPFVYAIHHGTDAYVRRQLLATGTAAIAAAGLAIALVLWPRRRKLHGDARYARRAEIAAAGLLAGNGILIGRLGRRYLMLAGQQGVILAAPPRSGKGVGVVIPNCLNWPGSLVCVDIKGENWAVTAGYRAHCGQRVFRFDPFAESGRTVRWNPLSYVAQDPQLRINDLQRIAAMLYPDAPGADPFWTASARSLFLGIALYLFETEGARRTLGEILRQGMANDDEGFGKHWKRTVEDRAKAGRPLSAQCRQALFDVIDLAPVTASSIRKTFTSRLDLWLNPMLDAATEASDFDFRDLRKAPISIYVCVAPDDLHRLRPVLNLFFQQAIGMQTRELPEHNHALRHQVLMMLDEFTALGRIPIVAEAIAYLPGYNVRTVLVIQTPAQLREVYGRDAAETMVKSLAARIVFAPKDHADAQEISDELGFTTVKAKSLSRPAFGAANRSPSTTVSEQRRALLLPQEVKELGTQRALVFYEGLRPIACEKVRYFEDPVFTARLMRPPEVAPIRRTEHEPSTVHASPAQPSPQAPVAPTDDDPESPRPAQAEDAMNRESLQEEDFAIDFDAVAVPKDRPLTNADVHDVIDGFLGLVAAGGDE